MVGDGRVIGGLACGIDIHGLVCVCVSKIRYYVDLLHYMYITVAIPEERLKEHV
jgi:hypothetical protein